MTVDELFLILQSEKPSDLIKKHESEIFKLIPHLEKTKGFNQNSDWHIYDIYEHTLHVVDNTNPILELRLAALFHDIGKPYTYSIDENGKGHFYNHWVISEEIFRKFIIDNNLSYDSYLTVCNLILYHDLNLLTLKKFDIETLLKTFTKEEFKMLFNLKRADLLAQNPKYNYYLDVINDQEKMIEHLTHSEKVL